MFPVIFVPAFSSVLRDIFTSTISWLPRGTQRLPSLNSRYFAVPSSKYLNLGGLPLFKILRPGHGGGD